MKAILTTLTLALALVACGGGPAPEFPHTFATEDQDAWLETHCARKAVFDTNANAFNDAMKRAGANFAELIAFDHGAFDAPTMSVKAFACRVRPNWYGADSLDTPEDL
jgi:hypothetical protein